MIISHDLKFAVRSAMRMPLSSLLVIVTLALGIGANTAMFSLFHQLLMRPLPVLDASQLVNLTAPGPMQGPRLCGPSGACEYVFSYPTFRDLEQEAGVFDGIAAHRTFNAHVVSDDVAETGYGVTVSGDYFSTLRLTPALGRLIDRQDDAHLGESNVVVLAHHYWQSRFGADPDVVGRKLRVNGHDLMIVGVAPARFSGTTLGQRAHLFVPLTLRWKMEPFFSPQDAENRKAYWMYVFARLRDDRPLAQAEAAINVPYRAIIQDIEAPLQTMPPEQLAEFRAKAIVLESGLRGHDGAPTGLRAPVQALVALTVIVLAIACVNMANLVLVRGAARNHELAVRAAVGASRARLVRQLLLEIALIGAAGCALSVPVASATLAIVGSLVPSPLGWHLGLSLDLGLTASALAVSLAVVVAFGVLPALRSSDVRRAPAATSRVRSTLVAVQVAFSVVLLALAGVFVQSLLNLQRESLGVDTSSLSTFSVVPVLSGLPVRESPELFHRIEEALKAQPGLVDVASASVAILTGSSWSTEVRIPGLDAAPDASLQVPYNRVSPSYFRTVGLPVLRGRAFTDDDVVGAPGVVLINESFVQRYGLGDSAVGTPITIGPGGVATLEVIGVVADAKYAQVRRGNEPQFFVPVRQSGPIGYSTFYVRSMLPPDQVRAAVEASVGRVAPGLPIDGFRTVDEAVADSLYLDRLVSTLSTAFAGLATLLAALGVYAVLSYAVSQRTREMGLRQALGATRGRLQRLVLGHAIAMTAAGLVVGLGAATQIGRVVSGMLFGVNPLDPWVLGAAATVLLVVAGTAGYLPARRAARVSPLVALRHD